MKSYEQFWAAMTSAYPVSRGKIRLPIVAELYELPGVDTLAVMLELRWILEQLLAEAGDGVTARARATAAGEDAIVPYITDTYSGVVRFDCVLTDAGVKVLELNADYPDGLLLHDRTYSVLSGTPCTLHADAFLSYFPPHSTIHISHAPQATFLDAYYVEEAVLTAAGHTVSIGAPPATAPQWHRRCVEASKVVADDLAWCTDGRSQHLNSFALRTLGYKDLLAHVTHPYIPQTLLIDARTIATVRATPEAWVVKPANGCEGQGIFFGRDYTHDEWHDMVGALPAGYIAQEYVTIPQTTVPLYDAETIAERTLYYDFCPHFFIQDGQVVGNGHILMRFSASPVVNVTQGGAIGYHRLP